MRTQDKELSKVFSDNIRRLQAKNGIKTDSEIICNISISQSRFSDLMNNKALPSILECLELSKYFNVTVDSLLSDMETENAKSLDWLDMSAYDLLQMFIDMYDTSAISLISKEDLATIDCTHTEGAIQFYQCPRLHTLLSEWKDLSAPIMLNENLKDKGKLINTLKAGFLSSVKDELLTTPLQFMTIPYD